MKTYEQFISKEKIKEIHNASLKILEETGVCFENERALDILRDHGCDVTDKIAKIPHSIVEKCLEQLPPFFTLNSNVFKPVTLGQDHDQIITTCAGNV